MIILLAAARTQSYDISVRLQDLFAPLQGRFLVAGNPVIQNIQFDSRKIQPGSLFVAVAGMQSDGHDFLAEAAKQGAAALVIQEGGASAEQLSALPESMPVVAVQDSRASLDFLASIFYEYPSENLLCFGITGTNGKTSLAFLLEHLLNHAGVKTGVIGTIDHHVGSQVWPSEMTTPDALLLQKRLAQMKSAGAQAVAMEITSHALEQKRADSVELDIAIFTNLTQDHLDYHGTMEKYFSAKQKLFNEVLPKSKKKIKTAVVNISDPWGAKLQVGPGIRKVTYGKTPADFQYSISHMTASGTEFSVVHHGQKTVVKSPLSGDHNVQNVLAAMVAAHASGVPWIQLVNSIQTFPGVPGRLQRIANNRGISVFVDYAHTPDALQNVLTSLQEVRQIAGLSRAQIWTVFGCGGDRDRGKRPIMARIAEKLSDGVMVTSDNPRTEAPELIMQEILAGFLAPAKVLVEPDRKTAIEKVLGRAKKDDIVLIAGKGHENYQIVGTQKIHLSDIEIANHFLKGKT